jgi:hypothetical protein
MNGSLYLEFFVSVAGDVEGYGFKRDAKLQVTNTLGGHKLGWVLGAMLYEINSLPWVYEDPNCPSPGETDANGYLILQEPLETDPEDEMECSDGNFFLHSVPCELVVDTHLLDSYLISVSHRYALLTY